MTFKRLFSIHNLNLVAHKFHKKNENSKVFEDKMLERETNCPSIYRKEVLGKCSRRVSNDPRARNILALEKHLRRSTPTTTR